MASLEAVLIKGQILLKQRVPLKLQELRSYPLISTHSFNACGVSNKGLLPPSLINPLDFSRRSDLDSFGIKFGSKAAAGDGMNFGELLLLVYHSILCCRNAKTAVN